MAYYQRRRNQKTGTHIVVCPSRDEVTEEEAAEAPWMTICEEHSTCCSHDTLQLARSWAACPDWCEECQGLMRDGKKHHAIEPSSSLLAHLRWASNEQLEVELMLKRFSYFSG